MHLHSSEAIKWEVQIDTTKEDQARPEKLTYIEIITPSGRGYAVDNMAFIVFALCMCVMHVKHIGHPSCTFSEN